MPPVETASNESSPSFRLDVPLHDLLTQAASRTTVSPATTPQRLPDPVFPPGVTRRRRLGTAHTCAQAPLHRGTNHAVIPGLGRSVVKVARPAGRFSPHHRLPVHRVEMQSRLPLLLGFR